jgi:hypothetical protein
LKFNVLMFFDGGLLHGGKFFKKMAETRGGTAQ